MITLITVLIVIAAIALVLIVLVQKSKGGGLSSSFSSSNAIMGVRKTTDFLEKATWGLASFIMVLSIITVMIRPKTTAGVPQTDVSAPIQQAPAGIPDMSTTLPINPGAAGSTESGSTTTNQPEQTTPAE